MSKALQLLGGLTAQQFLRRHWQKRPLLIRQALPGFNGVLSRAQLLRLASHPDCHARLIWRRGARWYLRRGPFSSTDFAARGARAWTVLVQDVNHAAAQADALLRLFNFIPYARLDDLMVSYATAGGGVGPHVDSYDVFLLQGQGQRRWQISQQRNHAWHADAPLKLLANFEPSQEWVLEPGDMLYLPPGVAHCGTALSDCFTYSIGFRTASNMALQQGLLRFIEDRCNDARLYTDPDLVASRQPAAISDRLLERCQQILEGVEWSRSDMVTFLGEYLSEPKATTFFVAPQRPLSLPAFARQAQQRGVVLHAKTRMLFYRQQVFVNGESYRPRAAAATLKRLANERALSAAQLRHAALDEAALGLLFHAYSAGYLNLAPLEKRKR